MDLLKRFEGYIREHSLFQGGDCVLLAVSGGVDSVVLLDLFLRIQSRWDIRLAVVHVNHSLRGREADQDEVFVKDLAQTRRLLFFSHKEDVKQFARVNRLSLEEGAREVRFRFFDSVLNRLCFNKVALGHHANDQAETILMNLMRGSGLRGLGGIRPARGRVIHPLLFASRKEIESYADGVGLGYVVDRSNRDLRFLRNRMRWDVIGDLERIVGPHVVSTICRTGMATIEAETFLNHSAVEARRQIVIIDSPNEIVLDIGKFLHYFKAIQKMVLIQVLGEVSVPQQRVRYVDIDRILALVEAGRSGGVVEVGNGVRVVRSGNTLAFLNKNPSVMSREVLVGQTMMLSDVGVRFRSTLLRNIDENIVFTDDRRTEYVDYDSLTYPLVLRSFQPGDWFIPLGMNGKKKLHDFFIDEGIPNYRRSSVPILIAETDIVWITGHRIDDRFKVTPKSDHVLKLEIDSLS